MKRDVDWIKHDGYPRDIGDDELNPFAQVYMSSLGRELMVVPFDHINGLVDEQWSVRMWQGKLIACEHASAKKIGTIKTMQRKQKRAIVLMHPDWRLRC